MLDRASGLGTPRAVAFEPGGKQVPTPCAAIGEDAPHGAVDGGPKRSRAVLAAFDRVRLHFDEDEVARRGTAQCGHGLRRRRFGEPVDAHPGMRCERFPVRVHALLDVCRAVPFVVGHRRPLGGEARANRRDADRHANDGAVRVGPARFVQDARGGAGLRRIMFVASRVITGSAC